MPTPTPSQLAGRGVRLLARILDGLIGAVPMWILAAFTIPSFLASIQAAKDSGALDAPGYVPPFPGTLILYGFLWFLIFSIIQLVYLTTRGQTLGKMICKVKIVLFADGKNGGFVPNVLLRAIVNTLIGIVPFYGIVDIFFIFREDRRCIHDLIAGTTVVKA